MTVKTNLWQHANPCKSVANGDLASKHTFHMRCSPPCQSRASTSANIIFLVQASMPVVHPACLSPRRSGALTMAFSNDGSWLAVACECNDGRYGIR